MEGQKIAKVTYLSRGNTFPKVKNKTKVWVVAFAEYMALSRLSDDRQLLKIPWANIENFGPKYIPQLGESSLGPIMPFRPYSSGDGVMIRYMEQIGDQTLWFEIFLKTKSKSAALNLDNYLWKARMRFTGDSGQDG